MQIEPPHLISYCCNSMYHASSECILSYRTRKIGLSLPHKLKRIRDWRFSISNELLATPMQSRPLDWTSDSEAWRRRPTLMHTDGCRFLCSKDPDLPYRSWPDCPARSSRSNLDHIPHVGVAIGSTFRPVTPDFPTRPSSYCGALWMTAAWRYGEMESTYQSLRKRNKIYRRESSSIM